MNNMSEKKEMKIAEVKGRPMLHWIGKQPLEIVKSFPSQLIETFNTKDAPRIPTYENLKKSWSNLLIHGDNKEVLSTLLVNGFRGKINLIYIDPPFNTGIDYVRKITPRGLKTEKIEGEGYSFTEQIQYVNNWNIDAYLQFLYERLQIAKEVLAKDGIIFIRLDVHFGFYLRMIADEVFSQEMFQNEIIVNRIKKNVTEKGKRTIPNAVDYLYVYFRSEESEFKNVLKKLPGRKSGYWHNMDSPGISGPRELVLGGNTYYPSPGTHLKFPQKTAQEMFDNGKIREHPKSGILEYWVEERDYDNLDTNWSDIPGYSFETGYPTENSKQLLERVIEVGSKPDDIVLDFFCGSGTTMASAQKLKRRWIGCDINKGAIQTTSKRLQNIIRIQEKEILKEKSKLQLEEPTPSHTSFAHYKINDYDMQIQHNELKELVYEHIGIKRLLTDSFFDGILGTELVRIIPFNHPLSVLDIQLVKNELEKRKDETRDIVLVSLGMEVKVKADVDVYNKLRPVNKIRTIELRTDKKYGSFFMHKPAQADVEISKTGLKGTVVIKDFISPTILQRLNIDNKLFQSQIKDFRCMIDIVLIDTDYNGEVFNISISDVPANKKDFVKGKYEFALKNKNCKISVKIIDMLGEEVLITA